MPTQIQHRANVFSKINVEIIKSKYGKERIFNACDYNGFLAFQFGIGSVEYKIVYISIHSF
jgi:hypothetical protein